MNRFPHLLSPLNIKCPSGHLEVRNRVLVSAHVPGFAVNNTAGDDYVKYHRQYAANGVGMQITGGTPVHRSGLLGTSPDALWNMDDSIIPGYQQLSAAVHQEGGRILAQLAHSGGTVFIDKPESACWSASAIRSRATGRVSHAMSVDEIREVVSAYAAAAARVQQGGLDGVEILAAFGFLPQAFLSPLTNHRDDNYGGSLENRMRFLVSVLTAVRSELGADRVLGVRLPGDEFEPGGLDLEQMTMICQQLERSGLVDYFNIIAHTNFSHTGRSKHWPPTPAPHGVFVPLAAAIRKEVSLPVFAVGRIVNPLHAESIVADGQADMVGMTRAHICDPEIVAKIKNNALAQVRPCVGANTCIANRYAGKQIRCMHNPMVKLPGTVLRESEQSLKIAIVGAGPAGLETARLAAERGHAVTLFEAEKKVGGQLRLWASSSSMRELGRIIDWRIAELERLGVEIKLDTLVDAATLGKLDCDAIVVTTGAKDSKRELDTDATVAVCTPVSLLEQDAVDAESAIVAADGRGQAGLVAAERLLEQGVSVEIITSDYAVAADLDPTNRSAWYERLGKAGATFTAQHRISSIDRGTVLLQNVFSQQVTKRSCIDLLVDWNGATPEDSLLRSMNGQNAGLQNDNAVIRPQWFSAGDCLAPRNVEVAMAEALAIVQQL